MQEGEGLSQVDAPFCAVFPRHVCARTSVPGFQVRNTLLEVAPVHELVEQDHRVLLQNRPQEQHQVRVPQVRNHRDLMHQILARAVQGPALTVVVCSFEHLRHRVHAPPSCLVHCRTLP